MKKNSFVILLLLSSLGFTSCTKQGTTGAAGIQGPTGANGTNLPSYFIDGSIPANTFNGASPNYYFIHIVPELDAASSNLVDAYFTTNNTTNSKAVYFQMPAYDVFTSGDELYYTIGHDTLIIEYSGTSQPPVAVSWRIDVIPQP